MTPVVERRKPRKEGGIGEVGGARHFREEKRCSDYGPEDRQTYRRKRRQRDDPDNRETIPTTDGRSYGKKGVFHERGTQQRYGRTNELGRTNSTVGRTHLRTDGCVYSRKGAYTDRRTHLRTDPLKEKRRNDWKSGQQLTEHRGTTLRS